VITPAKAKKLSIYLSFNFVSQPIIMISKWAYILIGDDRTGKTSFQKYLIYHLCGKDKFTKLNTNLVHDITHRDAPRKLKTLFTINRSIQEKMGVYKSVENYFEHYFHDADIVILSSHSHNPCIADIVVMISELKKRYYNVNVVFFSNHLNLQTQAIAELNWHEKLLINNPFNLKDWRTQIDKGARYFTEMLIKKLSIY
jgi:hypothetical protein